MADRPGDFLRRGRLGMSDVERWNLEHDDDFDERAYLEEVEVRARKRRTHPSAYSQPEPSEAEKTQSPESAL